MRIQHTQPHLLGLQVQIKLNGFAPRFVSNKYFNFYPYFFRCIIIVCVFTKISAHAIDIDLFSKSDSTIILPSVLIFFSFLSSDSSGVLEYHI